MTTVRVFRQKDMLTGKGCAFRNIKIFYKYSCFRTVNRSCFFFISFIIL